MKVMLTVNTEQIDDVSVVIDMPCRPMIGDYIFSEELEDELSKYIIENNLMLDAGDYFVVKRVIFETGYYKSSYDCLAEIECVNRINRKKYLTL